MTAKKFKLAGVGNAIVDILTYVSDAELESYSRDILNMPKGGMTLIDKETAQKLYDRMGPSKEQSGGSAANTLAGFASFGGKAAFMGRVADDQLGDIFRHDMRAQGMVFDTPPLSGGEATGRCHVLITPEGQRTMATYLGAGSHLPPEALDPDLIRQSEVVYMEGYLFDAPDNKRAFYEAAKIAQGAGGKLSITLSDSFCVDKHRADFHDLVRNHVDILFANEDEIKSLYQTDDFAAAAAQARAECEFAVLTRGKKGAVLMRGQETAEITPVPTNVKDTTGAGDQFAAGVLYGLSENMDLATCGALGAKAASQIIAQMGPRPEQPFFHLLEDHKSGKKASLAL